MKRKVKKGIKILCQLVDEVASLEVKDPLNASSPIDIPNKIEKEGNSSGLKSYLIYLLYVYRSYGYIVSGIFDVRL